MGWSLGSNEVKNVVTNVAITFKKMWPLVLRYCSSNDFGRGLIIIGLLLLVRIFIPATTIVAFLSLIYTLLRICISGGACNLSDFIDGLSLCSGLFSLPKKSIVIQIKYDSQTSCQSKSCQR